MASIKFKLSKSNGVVVIGEMRPVDWPSDSLSWMVNWYPEMINLSGAPIFEDSHWNVPEIWQRLVASGENAAYVLVAEGQLQGFVTFRRAPYTGIDGAPCGYIPFVAVAPWNRSTASGKSKYRGIGTALIGFASTLGATIHKTTVLELSSLPGAEGFYTKIGFQRTGRKSPPPDNLNEFRLEQGPALQIIRALMSKFTK